MMLTERTALSRVSEVARNRRRTGRGRPPAWPPTSGPSSSLTRKRSRSASPSPKLPLQIVDRMIELATRRGSMGWYSVPESSGGPQCRKCQISVIRIRYIMEYLYLQLDQIFRWIF